MAFGVHFGTTEERRDVDNFKSPLDVLLIADPFAHGEEHNVDSGCSFDESGFLRGRRIVLCIE